MDSSKRALVVGALVMACLRSGAANGTITWKTLGFGDSPSGLRDAVEIAKNEQRTLGLTQAGDEAAFLLTPTPDADSILFRFRDGRLFSMSHQFGLERLAEQGGFAK